VRQYGTKTRSVDLTVSGRNSVTTIPQAFVLKVADEAIADLHDRLSRTRLPDQAPDSAWTFGCDVEYLRGLLAYWQSGFVWRAQEAALNAFPQFRVPLHGSTSFLHVPGEGVAPMPLLLSHGWPGSVFEFIDLIPRLAHPSHFGGKAADAFTVVAPSLPGYGLSFRPGQKRFSIEAITDCLADLMTDVLGYRRFAAQGGDWGAFVASRLGAVHADKIVGIHINLLAVRRDPTLLQNSSEEERRYAAELAEFLKEETGYQWIQGTRPQTLAFGLSDSPAGLAAWIVEKFRAWTDSQPLIVIGCSRIYRYIGSQAASAHHFTRITPECTGRGPSRAQSTFRWVIASSPKRSSGRRVLWPSESIPTFAAGPSCNAEDTSPPWSRQMLWLMRSANSFGRCGLTE
jgi:pimeloyl-ACP methyl ester carboxylesterase